MQARLLLGLRTSLLPRCTVFSEVFCDPTSDFLEGSFSRNKFIIFFMVMFDGNLERGAKNGLQSNSPLIINIKEASVVKDPLRL